MKLSSIFYRYGEDFGGEAGIAQFVRPYLPDNQAKLIASGDYEISYLDYNWSLNQSPGPY